jgi:glycosyltransferase involved in cell wall biosynthesis
MLQYPKISIITPSFNQGQFIEETILSVLGQNYPNLEYIIIDGGSTDDTIEIIKKYEKHLHYWISEKDNGQSHAINKGFERASGAILCWLNSDDLYMPGCLFYVAEQINSYVKEGILFGNCLHFKTEDTGLTAYGSNVPSMFRESLLENHDFIIQPSSFWTKATWNAVGKLREDIHYAFDWEWFLRAKKIGTRFYSTSKCLSMYRLHETHKTATGGNKRQQEILQVYNMYSEKYAKLYQMLMAEDLQIKDLKKRAIRKMLSIFRKPHSNVDILKLLNYRKYSNYASKEIVLAANML